MTTPTKEAPAKGAANGGKKAPPMMRPFFPGTLDLETHNYSKSENLSTVQVPLDTYYVKTNGFLADMFLIVSTNATPNTDNDVTFDEDSPWNVIALFTLSDTGGKPILGPMSGWELKEFVKWGGFSFSDDPQQSQTYAATTGTSTAGGFFKFILQIPCQFVRREPLGPLPNTNNQTTFAVDITLNTRANVYGTEPDGTVTVTTTIQQDSYRQSSGKDAQGNATVTTPPGLGAVLYLRRKTQDVLTGSQQFRLPPQEGLYRVLSFVFRDSNGSRSQGESDWPDPWRLHYNNDVPYDRLKAMWIRRMERDYGYVAAIETAGGRSRGHFVLPFIVDHELKAGSEDRYRYLAVSAADTLEFDGSVGGSGTHTLTTMFDFVNPPGGNIRALTAR